MNRILYVEDDEVTRNFVVKMLCEDYDIDSAETALQAIRKIKDNFYHLFLLDINLGVGETGIDIMKHIKDYSHYKNTPIIAITSNWQKKDCFLSLGFNHFISKPFSKGELIEIIKKALQNSEHNY